jgi:predicted PurR-regulated permease PerM
MRSPPEKSTRGRSRAAAGGRQVIGYLVPVTVPVAIALLLAALLTPAVGYLVRHKVPRWLATVLVLVGGLAVLGGLLTFVIITFVDGLPALQTQLTHRIDAVANWLTTGPERVVLKYPSLLVRTLVTGLRQSRHDRLAALPHDPLPAVDSWSPAA